MTSGRKLVQRVLPFAVSAGALVWLLQSVDVDSVASALSWRVALLMGPVLPVWGMLTLLLEARSILCLIEAPTSFGTWTAARVKCASYLLAIVNYTLGAAALAILLRRRAGLRLAEAASAVLLIGLVDMLILLVLAASGAALSPGEGPALRAGLFSLAGLGFVVGMLLLRAPASLGPLERVRSLAVFQALRTTPLRHLGELFALRVLFVVVFLSTARVVFLAFEVPVPFGRFAVGMVMVTLVGVLPIAVAGLGTSQAAVLILFRGLAGPETLLAMSLVLSAGMIATRAVMGVLFAREFTREALQEARTAET